MKGTPRPEPTVIRMPATSAAMMGSAVLSSTLSRKEKSMAILSAGVDLAKNVFALHGVENGHRHRSEERAQGVGGARPARVVQAAGLRQPR